MIHILFLYKHKIQNKKQKKKKRKNIPASTIELIN
jgi:hypothetical protein